MEMIWDSRGLYVGRHAQIIAVPSWMDDHNEAFVNETILVSEMSIGYDQKPH